MKAVYVFQNGGARNGADTYLWLRHYGFNPRWGPAPPGKPGASVIEVPDHEVSGVALIAKANPARFGNESEVLRRAAGDLSASATVCDCAPPAPVDDKHCSCGKILPGRW